MKTKKLRINIGKILSLEMGFYVFKNPQNKIKDINLKGY